MSKNTQKNSDVLTPTEWAANVSALQTALAKGHAGTVAVAKVCHQVATRENGDQGFTLAHLVETTEGMLSLSTAKAHSATFALYSAAKGKGVDVWRVLAGARLVRPHLVYAGAEGAKALDALVTELADKSGDAEALAATVAEAREAVRSALARKREGEAKRKAEREAPKADTGETVGAALVESIGTALDAPDGLQVQVNILHALAESLAAGTFSVENLDALRQIGEGARRVQTEAARHVQSLEAGAAKVAARSKR